MFNAVDTGRFTGFGSEKSQAEKLSEAAEALEVPVKVLIWVMVTTDSDLETVECYDVAWDYYSGFQAYFAERWDEELRDRDVNAQNYRKRSKAEIKNEARAYWEKLKNSPCSKRFGRGIAYCC